MDAKSHWLHLFDFSSQCVFKCLLKSPARDDAKSHWLHLFDFSPLFLFKCVLNVLGSEWTYNRIGCISLALSHCSFSSASSSFLFDSVHTCNGCICLCVSKCALKFIGNAKSNSSHLRNFSQFVYSDVHLNVMHARPHTHTVYICVTFLCYLFLGIRLIFIFGHFWETE